jgi:hypothetical protein
VRDYQDRECIGNNDDNPEGRAHFLRILSMVFPLASSSTLNTLVLLSMDSLLLEV